jgi:hypothetical protein
MSFASARRAARIVKTAAACQRSRYQYYGQKSQHALEVVQPMLVSGAPPLTIKCKQVRNRRVHCTSRVCA